MKSLQEIEPRTIISSVPFTISTPGSYYLSNNLTVAAGTAITIAANDVTLNLNGFTISSTTPSATGNGILIGGSAMNVSIVNGSIHSGVTDNGAGVFSGSGFAHGIYCALGDNIRVSNVSVLGCLMDGIFLNGNATMAEKCMVYTVGSRGISANVVVGSAAFDCGSDGIDATTVADSCGQSAYGGMGINTLTANNCYGTSASGTGLNAGSSANNCYGTSGSGYYGIYSVTAINCYGTGYATNSIGILAYNVTGSYGYGGSDGIYSYGTTIGCYGVGAYGDAIYAYAAENCYGNCEAPSGSYPYASIYAYTAHNCYGNSYYQNGLDVVLANNCYGYSSYGTGILGFNTTGTSIENCYGYSYNGIGINVFQANNCFGESQNSDGMDAHAANNCYGYTHAGAYGLLCSGTANNCLGNVVGGTQNYSVALQATTANNSFGVDSSSGVGGTGLYANVVNNCSGYTYSSSGTGLRAYYSATGSNGYALANYTTGLNADIAIGCYGSAAGTGAIGLSAYIANSCDDSSSSISYKYNMP